MPHEIAPEEGRVPGPVIADRQSEILEETRCILWGRGKVPRAPQARPGYCRGRIYIPVLLHEDTYGLPQGMLRFRDLGSLCQIRPCVSPMHWVFKRPREWQKRLGVSPSLFNAIIAWYEALWVESDGTPDSRLSVGLHVRDIWLDPLVLDDFSRRFECGKFVALAAWAEFVHRRRHSRVKKLGMKYHWWRWREFAEADDVPLVKTYRDG